MDACVCTIRDRSAGLAESKNNPQPEERVVNL
jgi:hypothetical protein